ncbi:MAG: hypothetical protein FJW92_00710 [Actinobacteria bacterium]|nr:hypothetical protein [Actinomycetota bacterium]
MSTPFSPDWPDDAESRCAVGDPCVQRDVARLAPRRLYLRLECDPGPLHPFLLGEFGLPASLHLRPPVPPDPQSPPEPPFA